MSKTIKITLGIIGGIVLSALIFGGGMLVAQANWGVTGINPSNMTQAPAPTPALDAGTRGAGVGWAANGENPGASVRPMVTT